VMRFMRFVDARCSISVLVVTTVFTFGACGGSSTAPTPGPTLDTTLASLATSVLPAVDLASCLEGRHDSACFNARTVGSSSVSVAAVVNSAPTNLTWSANGTTVLLVWTSPALGDPAVSYIIEAGSSSGLSDLASVNTGNTSTSLTVSGVPPGVYYVRVRARNGGGTGAASSEIVVIVGGGGSCAGAPRSLTASSTGSGVSLSWAAPVSGVPISYVIQAGSASGRSDLAILDTNSTVLTFTATGVSPGTYYVRLYSRSTCGLSGSSNEAQVSVMAAGSAGNVSGNWVGTLTQSTNTFAYRMQLAQTGSQVTGTAHIERALQAQYFADFAVSGSVDANGAFRFQELRITAQNPPPGASWCVKSGTLQYSTTQQRRLMGNWTAPGCVPGTIDLLSP